MAAHSSSPSFFERARAWWKRIFFWQSVPAASQEYAPLPTSDKELVAGVTAPKPLPRWQQLRYLSHVFSRKERLQFWTSALAGFSFLLIAGAFFIQPHLLRQPTTGGILTEGLIGSPKWVNPILAPLNDVDRDLSQLIFSSLFIYDGLTLRPDLAASTNILDQGRTLEIHLREDVHFHDGQPLSADDVVFTINDAIKNPSWHSPLANNFKEIEAIRIDEHTVQIKMTGTPFTIPQLESLLTVGILPGHRWQDVNDGSPQLAEENLKPIGSGPYAFETFTRDTRGAILTYTLKRFEGYYGQLPYIDQRQFRFYGDRKEAEIALQSNQIDTLAFVPWSEQDEVRATDTKAIQIELPQVATLFFNTQDTILKDLNVRASLQKAIDRGELSQEVAHVTPLQDPFPFYETYSTSSQLMNLDEARQLLETSRWKLDSATGERFLQPAPVVTRTSAGRVIESSSTSTSPFSTSTPLTISLLVPAQSDLQLVADYLKRRWSLLGANVVVEPLDREEIIRRSLTDRAHQVVLLNVLAQDDQDLLTFWNKDPGNLNFSQWSSPALISGFQALSTATTTNAIMQARSKITDLILTQQAAVFLFRPSYAYLLQSNLQGTRNIQIRSPADRLVVTQDWYLDTRLCWQSTP